MYERMLNKQVQPSIEEMMEYCAENAGLFLKLNNWIEQSFQTETKIVFPYGNNYGWGIAHRRKNILVCNVFPEDGAFSVMIRLTNKQFDSIYSQVDQYTKEYIDQKYPCNDGGWIHYRVKCEKHYNDIIKIISVKCLA